MKLIGLGLRDIKSASPVQSLATFRALLCELLDFFDDVLSAADEGLDGEKVAHYRGMLAAAVDQDQISAMAGPILTVCQETFERLKRQREGTREEVMSLILQVRDAVAMIVGEGHAFSTDLTDTTKRLEALREIPDLLDLKASLAREVRSLKQVARDREQRFQATVSVFETRVALLEDQLRKSQEEASVDPMTGVANRRAFDRALRDCFEKRGHTFVLAVLDVDDFKRINDTYGHAKGDTVLRMVADALKAAVRGDDLVARIGGDEFALIATGLTLSQAERRLHAVTTTLKGANAGMGESHVTISCGIAEYSAGDTPLSLMTRADEAVYDAKRRGKNHIITRALPFIRDLCAS